MGQLFEYDPVTRTKRTYVADHIDDAVVIATEQDVTELVDANRRAFNAVDERARFGGESFYRMASIPMNVYMKLQVDGVADDEKAFKRWLNDPDNRVFRTRPGRV